MIGGDAPVTSEENTWVSLFTSFGIHILLIIVAIFLKWQYDRNRYRYPKGPRDWTHIKDVISYNRKKRENLLKLVNNYPETCTVMTHTGRLVLLNNLTTINEIFLERAELVSNKVDNYLEDQLRYKEGKHIRTGIVFRHQDHNAQIIHRVLVNHLSDDLVGKRFDTAVQSQLQNLTLSNKFDVRRTTFYFAVRILTSLCYSSTSAVLDNRTLELFEQDLYNVSKAVHEDSVQKSAKSMFSKLVGSSETLDINKNVLNFIKAWVKDRLDVSNGKTGRSTIERSVTTATNTNRDFLDSILSAVNESSPRLDEDDIAACILDIIMHGSEMMKAALSWLLLYVVRYPEEADLCRREVRQNGYSKFNLSSAGSLSYTQAFVKEVLRLSPVVPVAIHSTLQDFRWRNFHIQKRTQFGANIFALHYSKAWNDPSTFNVKRWLEQDSTSIANRPYSPFGFGPRACIAEKHAFDLLTGILGVLLYNNDFDKAGIIADPADGTFGLANIPPKFSLKVTALSVHT